MSISCTNFSKAALAVALLALAPMSAHAQLSKLADMLQVKTLPPSTLPPELMNGDKPIDAMCFEEVSADEWLDINDCVRGEIVKLPPVSSEWTAGKIGYHYRYSQDSSDAESYSYYYYIGQWNGSPVVVSYASAGGTGQFSSLTSIERSGNKIRVLQGFGAGDRCNGGIVDAQIRFGDLLYGQNMTPIDFLQIADDNPNDLQPYDDLEASATSCFGVARFRDTKFEGVTLTDIPPATKGIQPTYKYQRCFNDLFRKWIAAEKKELTVEELKQFTGEFNQVCLKK